ncbi:hypothetical protein BDN70DRAFT_899549 [Pholiota conissans]|uniref:Uncharacterized protein n=1 Tax=Pholiota conissans TaxID=109636 RepID=A0A9P6CVL7_9AGAR|nr:hypothetical protein BDN70DRAFT_899549 [Pholiota conissans]
MLCEKLFRRTSNGLPTIQKCIIVARFVPFIDRSQSGQDVNTASIYIMMLHAEVLAVLVLPRQTHVKASRLKSTSALLHSITSVWLHKSRLRTKNIKSTSSCGCTAIWKNNILALSRHLESKLERKPWVYRGLQSSNRSMASGTDDRKTSFHQSI